MSLAKFILNINIILVLQVLAKGMKYCFGIAYTSVNTTEIFFKTEKITQMFLNV